MLRYIAIALGVVLVGALVVMTTSRSRPTESMDLLDPELLVLMCIEGEGCSASFTDKDLGQEVKISSEELFMLTQLYEEVWREDHSAFQPLSIAVLYLFVANDHPAAYASYSSFIRELIDSDMENYDLYETVFTMTWEQWAMRESPHMLEALEVLYDKGRSRARLSGFDTNVRYHSDLVEDSVLDPFVCTGLSDQLIILAILGDTIRAHDLGLWQMHAGDAAMSCYICEGVPDHSYSPTLAWVFYEESGQHQDSNKASMSMGNASLAAAMDVVQDELNICQEEFTYGLQQSMSSAALVESAISWYQQAGLSPELIIFRLEISEQYAKQVGRPDLAINIRLHIASLGAELPGYAPSARGATRSSFRMDL